MASAVALVRSHPVFPISFPVARGTFPTAINMHGEIAGYCVDSIAAAHGFVRDAHGEITVFDAPGSGPQERQGTFVTDINNDGTIVGYYLDTRRVHHGFARDRSGAITTLDAPGAGTEVIRPVWKGHPEMVYRQGTVAARVNDSDTITGYFIDAESVRHGFLRDRTGQFKPFDVPGGGDTIPESINDSGVVTGKYSDPPIVVNSGLVHSYQSGKEHGFQRDADGAITTYDQPKEISLPELKVHPKDSVGCEVVTASDEPGGALVGHYADKAGNNHAFFLDSHGALITFDAPCEGNAVAVTSVSPLVAGATEKMIIRGRHFGNFPPSGNADEGRVVIQDSAISRSCGIVVTPEMQDPSLHVTGWTDDEIVVTGFRWPSNGPCPFHAGDSVSVGVWNTQTGAGPAYYDLSVGTTSKDLTPPRITSVTPVYPRADQTFAIEGEGFGTQPTDQDSIYIDLVNETVSWVARTITTIEAMVPDNFPPATIKVGRWTPHEIDVIGLGGGYGRNHWTLNGGDHVTIHVWNPQTGAGPATYELTVTGTGNDLIAPHIASVTPIAPQASQVIIITGQGFGTRPASINQTTPYLEMADETRHWVAGRVGLPNAYAVLLSVSRWTDTEIEVTGFGGAYGSENRRLNAGDQIAVKVWNAQTGAGPAATTTQVMPTLKR